jgi:tRNA A37 threonylcarbamoyladenosine modification protein TsaB
MMTKNQLYVTLAIVVIVAVAFAADAAEKAQTIERQSATIDAQRRKVDAAEYARAEESVRASKAEAERHRYFAKVGELEQQLRKLPLAPAGSQS